MYSNMPHRVYKLTIHVCLCLVSHTEEYYFPLRNQSTLLRDSRCGLTQLHILSSAFGKAVKNFAFELSKLYLAYADCSSLEAIALKARTVIPILLLQEPFSTLCKKSIQHALQNAWKSGRRVTSGVFWQSVTPYNLACPSCSLLEVMTNQIWITHSSS